MRVSTCYFQAHSNTRGGVSSAAERLSLMRQRFARLKIEALDQSVLVQAPAGPDSIRQ